MSTDGTTASHRTKQFIRVGKFSDQVLRLFNFPPRKLRILLFAQRHAMRKRMVADPVPLRVRPCSQGERVPIRKFLANHEKCGSNIADE